MKKIDLLIHVRHMFTMEGDGVGYKENYGLAVDGGKIIAVEPSYKLKGEYTAEKTFDQPHLLALPGFLDCHMHTRHAVIRGVSQDLVHWMWEGMAPFEAQTTSEAKKAGSRLAIAEAILSGTTTIGDDGPDLEGAIENIICMGARGNVSPRIREVDYGTYAPGELYNFHEGLGEKSLNDCIRLFQKYDGYDDGRIRILFGPQGSDFLSEGRMKQVHALAKQYHTKMHMHLTQGSREDEQILKRHGLRPVPYLDKIGVIDDNLIGVHLTSGTKEEVELVAKRGASMILCSSSIGVINGEVPPAQVFIDAGGPVGLGSDQSPGNNNHNIFNEMKLTALLNKCKYETPLVMPAYKVLRMATIEGAKALGLENVTGSLEVGKAADIILINLRSPTLSPVITKPMRNIVPNLVYAARGNEVDTVIVNGKLLMEQRKPLTFDIDEIIDDVQRHADDTAQRAAERFNAQQGTIYDYMQNDQL
ncbi:amidohydrolase family protein [Christensenellaceae bacterium OttesenSCG-928-M15]|nr:amidohydrolase family protein [Christensenellaceae bacterium OttesenSCG-928-M15]